jgi:hypothetical protein
VRRSRLNPATFVEDSSVTEEQHATSLNGGAPDLSPRAGLADIGARNL